jgi:hypothetical protein
MPRSNDAGLLESWFRFDTGGPNLFGFFRAIIDLLQNRVDNLQSRMPGFRDRIAHIWLTKSEGGLNLDMPGDVVRRLAARGAAAGDLLRQRFASPAPGEKMNFTNHRWVRYRTTFSAIQRMLSALRRNYGYPAPGEPPYAVLIRRPPDAEPKSYEFSDEQRVAAPPETDTLLGLATQWDQHPWLFTQGNPRPPGDLRIRPD